MNKLQKEIKQGQRVIVDGTFYICQAGNGMSHLNIGHAIFAHEKGKGNKDLERVDDRIDLLATLLYQKLSCVGQYQIYGDEKQLGIITALRREFVLLEKATDSQIRDTIHQMSATDLFQLGLKSVTPVDIYPNDPEMRVPESAELEPVAVKVLSLSQRTGTEEFEDSDMERAVQHLADDAILAGIEESRIIEILTECMSPNELREAYSRIDGDISDNDLEALSD